MSNIVVIISSGLILISIFFAICAVSKISMMFFSKIFTSKEKGKCTKAIKEGWELAKPDFIKFIKLMALGLMAYFVAIILAQL